MVLLPPPATTVTYPVVPPPSPTTKGESDTLMMTTTTANDEELKIQMMKIKSLAAAAPPPSAVDASAFIPKKIKLKTVNPHITCNLCTGYLIDATTIVECLHSFCHSCIMKHLRTAQYCPQCEMMINKAKPNIKPDATLQAIVYKLVPGLYEKELLRKRAFYKSHPAEAKLATPEQRGEDTENLIFNLNEKISLSLEYADLEDVDSNMELMNKYLLCPAVFRVSGLKKFVLNKYGINSSLFHVEIMYKVKTIVLPDDYTLMDVAYIYTWKREAPMKFFYRIRTNETKSEELPEVPLRRSPSVTRKSLTAADVVPAETAKLPEEEETIVAALTMAASDKVRTIAASKPIVLEDQYEFREEKKALGGECGLKIKYSSLKSDSSGTGGRKPLAAAEGGSPKPKKTPASPTSPPDSDKKCEKIKLKIENNSVSIVKNYSSTPSTSMAAPSCTSPPSQKSQSKHSKISNKLDKLVKSVISKNKKLMKLEKSSDHTRKIDEIFKKVDKNSTKKSKSNSPTKAHCDTNSPPSAPVPPPPQTTPQSALKSILKRKNSGDQPIASPPKSVDALLSPKKEPIDSSYEREMPGSPKVKETKAEENKVLSECDLKYQFLNTFELAPKQAIEAKIKTAKASSLVNGAKGLAPLNPPPPVPLSLMPPPSTTNVPVSSHKNQIRINILKRKNKDTSAAQRSLLKKNKCSDEEYKKMVEKIVLQRAQSMTNFTGTSNDPDKRISFNLSPYPIGTKKSPTKPKSPPKANAKAKTSPPQPQTTVDDSKIFKKPSLPAPSPPPSAANSGHVQRPTPHALMNFKRPAPVRKQLAAKAMTAKRLPFILPKEEVVKRKLVMPYVPPKERKNSRKPEVELQRVARNIMLHKNMLTTANESAFIQARKSALLAPAPTNTAASSPPPMSSLLPPSAGTTTASVGSGTSKAGSFEAGSKNNPKSMSNYLNYALMNSNKSLQNASTPFGTRTPIYSPNSPQYVPNYNLTSTPQYKYANPMVFESYLPKNGKQSPPLAADASRKRPCTSPPANKTAAGGKDEQQPPAKQQKTCHNLLEKINFPASLSITLTNEQDDKSNLLFPNPKRTSPPVNNYIEIVKLPDSPTKDDKSMAGCPSVTVSAANLLNGLTQHAASGGGKGSRSPVSGADKKDLLAKVSELNKKLTDANKCNEAPPPLAKAATSSEDQKAANAPAVGGVKSALPEKKSLAILNSGPESFQNKFLESILIKQRNEALLNQMNSNAAALKSPATSPAAPAAATAAGTASSAATPTDKKKRKTKSKAEIASSFKMPWLKEMEKEKQIAELIRKSKSISPPASSSAAASPQGGNKKSPVERKKSTSPLQGGVGGGVGGAAEKNKKASPELTPMFQVPQTPTMPMEVASGYTPAQMMTMMNDMYAIPYNAGMPTIYSNGNLFQQLWLNQLSQIQSIESQKYLQSIKNNNNNNNNSKTSSTNDG